MDKETYTPEAYRALNFLAAAGPLANTTLETKDYKSLMLHSGASVIGCGTLYNIVGKNLGAGVWKVSLKRAN